MTTKEITKAICVKLRKAELQSGYIAIKIADENEEITMKKKPQTLYVSADWKPSNSRPNTIQVKVTYISAIKVYPETELQHLGDKLFELLEYIELREGRTEPKNIRGSQMQFELVTKQHLVFHVQYQAY